MKDAMIRCGRCGTTKVEHRLVNFADGPLVGSPALICPTATFLDMFERPADARPDLALFEALDPAPSKPWSQTPSAPEPDSDPGSR